MKSIGGTIVAAALAWAVAGGAADAGVIYDNGEPTQDGTEATLWVDAQDFTLGAGGAVAGAGVYIAGLGGIGNWDGTADYFIFADNAGQPGTVLASGSGQNTTTTDTGAGWRYGGNVFLVEFDFESAFAAAAATTYWFGIHLSTNFDRDEIYWVSADANATHPSYSSEHETFDNWNGWIIEHAFFLTGAAPVSVPEPSILALLGVGLAGLGLVRARRTA